MPFTGLLGIPTGAIAWIQQRITKKKKGLTSFNGNSCPLDQSILFTKVLTKPIFTKTTNKVGISLYTSHASAHATQG
jgi:hypothetical protein